MIDTNHALAALRGALDLAGPNSSESDLDTAVAAATDELRKVAEGVAAFANSLDVRAFGDSGHAWCMCRELAARPWGR